VGALLARTEPSAPKHNGITYFLLDMASEGVAVRPLRELTGNEFFNEVFIDDVFVPDGLVLVRSTELGGQSQHPDAERVTIGSARTEPRQPGPSGRAHARWSVRPDRAKPCRPADGRGPCGQVLNMRSTLLTLAGGDALPSAAISKLLSMRTAQDYAEFGLASFGVDGGIGDTAELQGEWANYLLSSRATTIYGGTRGAD